jgi:hypothetical protein
MASPASQVIQRIFAAVLGGYALAAALSACLSLVLPMPRADAVITGLLVSFPLYVGIIMWVFAAHPLKRLWWQLGSATAGFGVLALVLVFTRGAAS